MQEIFETLNISVENNTIRVVKLNPKKGKENVSPLELLKELWEVKLFFILEEELNSCRNDADKILKTIDAFMRTFLDSLFTTRYDGEKEKLPLLTIPESKMWKEIIKEINNRGFVSSLQRPNLNDIKNQLQKNLFKEYIQAKKSIVSPEEISCIALLQCQDDRICYLVAFPRGIGEKECKLCLKLIYMTACRNCQELKNE